MSDLDKVDAMRLQWWRLCGGALMRSARALIANGTDERMLASGARAERDGDRRTRRILLPSRSR